MTPEEFRSAGHQLIDWIADYRSNLEQRPVRAQIEPGDIRRAFSQTPPETPPGAAGLLAELEQKIAKKTVERDMIKSQFDNINQ